MTSGWWGARGGTQMTTACYNGKHLTTCVAFFQTTFLTKPRIRFCPQHMRNQGCNFSKQLGSPVWGDSGARRPWKGPSHERTRLRSPISGTQSKTPSSSSLCAPPSLAGAVPAVAYSGSSNRCGIAGKLPVAVGSNQWSAAWLLTSLSRRTGAFGGGTLNAGWTFVVGFIGGSSRAELALAALVGREISSCSPCRGVDGRQSERAVEHASAMPRSLAPGERRTAPSGAALS